MSSIIRKLEEAVHPERREHGTTSTSQANPYTGKDDYTTAPIPPHRPHAPVPEGIDAPTGSAPVTTGPHRHDVLNKLDPSVDSRQGAPAVHHPSSAPLSSTGAGTGLSTGAGTLPLAAEGDHRRQTVPVAGADLPGPAPHTAGPHKHDFANKLDPSVDSKTGASTGNPHGRAGPAAAGVAAEALPRHHEPLLNTGVLPGPAPNTAGPHRYDMLNKLDPSVDSGVGPGHAAPGQTAATHTTGHHAAGHTAPVAATGHHTAHTAGHGHTAGVAAPVGIHEPHHHSKLTKVEPAIGGHGGAIHSTATHSAATGPAPNTAGPHRSDLMNELDPRVDAHPETVHGSTRRGI